MIISHDLKYMFIHFPKTGGTSIKVLFANKSKDFKPNIIGEEKVKAANLLPHSTISDGCEYLKNNGYDPDEYFKFVFIRNPWDRMVSGYEYTIQVRAITNKKYAFKSFKEFVHKQPTLHLLNRNFVNTNYKFDFIGKFENINEDMQTIYKKIMKNNYRHIDLPHKNAILRNHYRHYYDKETKTMVEKKFSKFIELGNYSF